MKVTDSLISVTVTASWYGRILQWAAAFIRRTRAFQKKLADEAVFQIKRLRNHPRWRSGAGDTNVIWLYSEWAGIYKRSE